MIDRGEYASAIANLERMVELVDEPSFILHNRLGFAYRWNRDHDNSIRHFSIAIDLNDTSVQRTNRATAYMYNNQCPEATEDANLALDRTLPESTTGYHPHVESLLLLSHCYAQSGNHSLALAHIETAIELAQSSGVSEERIESFARVKQQIEGIARGHAYPEDMLAGFVLVDVNQGMAKFYDGEERAAIVLFTSALEGHGRPSSRILNMLARSHANIGEHEKAVGYFSQAIELRDNSFNRTWRALQYLGEDDCGMAAADAEKALNMEPFVESGLIPEWKPFGFEVYALDGKANWKVLCPI